MTKGVGRQPGYLASVAWALTWRYAVLAGAVVADEYRVNAPSVLVAEFAGVLGLGVVIGLWHSRSRLAALWRALTLAVLVAYLGPAWPAIYPYALVLALAVATAEPWIAATRRRRAGVAAAVASPPAVGGRPSPGRRATADALPAWTQARSADGQFVWDGRSWQPVSAGRPRRRHSPRLLRAVVTVTALGAAGYVGLQNPSVTGRAAQAVEQAVGWVQDTVAPHSGPAARNGTTTALLGEIALSPAISPDGPSSATPTSRAEPTVAPAATPAPAAPAPMAPPPVWAAADCTWAQQTLRWDLQLDLSEAAAVATGSDTRYGTGPRVATYYTSYATKWSAVLGETAAVCSAAPVLPTQAQRSNATLWFYEAIAAHDADTLTHPSNASWNRMWAASYGRLITMWDALPVA